MTSDTKRAGEIVARKLRQGVNIGDIEIVLSRAGLHPAVEQEWTNYARRARGGVGSEELRGADYRAWQNSYRANRLALRKMARAKARPTPTRLQRIARRISRLFRKR